MLLAVLLFGVVGGNNAKIMLGIVTDCCCGFFCGILNGIGCGTGTNWYSGVGHGRGHEDSHGGGGLLYSPQLEEQSLANGLAFTTKICCKKGRIELGSLQHVDEV